MYKSRYRCTDVHMYICTYVHMCIRLSVCLPACLHACMHACMYVCKVCKVCIYTHAHAHTHRPAYTYAYIPCTYMRILPVFCDTARVFPSRLLPLRKSELRLSWEAHRCATAVSGICTDCCSPNGQKLYCLQFCPKSGPSHHIVLFRFGPLTPRPRLSACRTEA